MSNFKISPPRSKSTDRQYSAELVAENLEKVKTLLGQIKEACLPLGIQLDDQGRISMEQFSARDAEEDVEKLATAVRRMNRNQTKLDLPSLEISQPLESRLKASPGELLEILKTIILNKFISNKYIVVRASQYDDWITGVDNVIIHKESGEIVCAVDEITGDTVSESEYAARKLDEMFERNAKDGGINLKHGFVKEKDGKYSPHEVSFVPVFYLALPEIETIVAISQLGLSLEMISDSDLEIFEGFRKFLGREISTLETRTKNELRVRTVMRESTTELDLVGSRIAKLKTLRKAMNEAEKKER